MNYRPGGNLAPIVPAPGQNRLMTAGQIARQRTVAEALMAPNNRPITNWADGAAGLVDAFSGKMKMRQADEAEQLLFGRDQQIRNQAFGPMVVGAPMAQAPVPAPQSMQGISGLPMMASSGNQPPPSIGGFFNHLFGRR